MSLTNYKASIQAMGMIEIEKYENYEIKMTVSNQFTKFELESGLKNIDMVSDEDWNNYYSINANFKDVLFNASTFWDE